MENSIVTGEGVAHTAQKETDIELGMSILMAFFPPKVLEVEE